MRRLLALLVLWATLAPAAAKADVYFIFSADQLEFQGQKRFFFVPMGFQGPSERDVARRVGVLFEKLHSSRSSVYGDSYLVMKEGAGKHFEATLVLDPTVARFHDIIVGEVYLTLRNEGVERIVLGDSGKALSDGDVKYPTFLPVVPLWEALPPTHFSHALVRLGEERFLDSNVFYNRLSSKDAGLLKEITDLLKHEDAYVRYQVLKSFPLMGVPNDLPHLLPLLKDPDQGVQHLAIETLKDRKEKPVLDALADVADNDKDPETKLMAATILVANGRTNYQVYILFNDLKSEDPQVVVATLKKLASSGDKRVLPAITARLTDPREEVRQAAFDGLLQIRDLPTLQGLLSNAEISEPFRKTTAVELMRQNEATYAKAGVVYILAHHAGAEAVEAITVIEMRKYEDLAPELVKALGHQDLEVARAAVSAIGNLDLIALLPDLSKAAQRPELLDAVRATIVRLLANRPVKDVMAYAGSEDMLVRELAVLALVKAAKELQGPKQEPVLALLEQRMKDKELVIRQAAVQALFEIGGEANWTRVLKAKADPDIPIRLLAVDAALAMANEAGDAVILEKLDDESDEVRVRAIIAVRQRMLKVARPKLKSFVGSRNRDMKLETMRAINALNETQDDYREFFEVYKSSLYVMDADIQLAAIEGIQHILDPMVVPLLQSGMLLTHQDPRIRAATIIALGRSKDFNTIEDIARGFADPERSVQQAAIESLRLMGHKKGLTPLQEFIRQTPDDELRSEAQAVMEEINSKKGLLGP